MLKRRHSGIVFCMFLAICMPALAQDNEPYFSYLLNLIVESDFGGGVNAPVLDFAHGFHPNLIYYPSDYQTVAVDCYSSNGMIPSYVTGFDPTTYGLDSCETGSSFSLPGMTLTTQMGNGSSTNTVAGSATTISLSMAPSNPGPSLVTAVNGVINYSEKLAAPPGSQIVFPFSTVGTGNGNAFLGASSDCGNCSVYISSSAPGQKNQVMGPLTIGPSGQYTLIAQLSGSAENPGNVGLVSSITLNFCPMNVVISGNGTTEMRASATPPLGSTLSAAATACGYTGFDWQQFVTNAPCPAGVYPAVPSLVPDNVCSIATPTPGALFAGPSVTDPPNGGYTYQTVVNTNQPYNPYPFYYPTQMAATPNADGPYISQNGQMGVIQPININDRLLTFFDAPAEACLPTGPVPADDLAELMAVRAMGCGGPNSTDPPGSYLAFDTWLVGVNPDGSASLPLFTWSWTDTFNAFAGAINVPVVTMAPDPSTGAGNITIISINGVPVPQIVPSTQISVKASGLAYSRVTKTFNGTATITNISGAVISTPTSFQLVLNSLPSDVTLANSTGTFNQCPYLTIPTITSLAPGQSVTVALQFSNPSDATINFTPEFYAGSFQ